MYLKTFITYKAFLTLLLCTFLIATGAPALAQNATSSATSSTPTLIATSSTPLQVGTTTPSNIRDNRQENTEERTEAIQARVSERQDLRNVRQAALESAKQERVLRLAANISNRMEAAISRLYTIIGRFEQRISKLKEVGVNTSVAEAKLREAAQLLAEAQIALQNIDSQVYGATTSTEPQAGWQTVRETYLKAGEQIRASHSALRETLALLKSVMTEGITPVTTDSSTTTATTSTTTSI